MRPRMVLAILLIALGAVAFAYQGITYTTREKVVDLGPIQVTAEKTRSFPLSSLVAVGAVLGGLALLVLGNRKNG